jgi:hypothetical protein
MKLCRGFFEAAELVKGEQAELGGVGEGQEVGLGQVQAFAAAEDVVVERARDGAQVA